MPRQLRNLKTERLLNLLQKNENESRALSQTLTGLDEPGQDHSAPGGGGRAGGRPGTLISTSLARGTRLTWVFGSPCWNEWTRNPRMTKSINTYRICKPPLHKNRGQRRGGPAPDPQPHFCICTPGSSTRGSRCVPHPHIQSTSYKGGECANAGKIREPEGEPLDSESPFRLGELVGPFSCLS